VPLTSAGRALGYLQVADKRDGSPFDQNDFRLLEIVAGQAAIIIENATLFRQSQERAQRAEALRRVASLTGSAATLDEILQFSLRELARLLRADVAAIFLVDESRGELRLHKESLFGISEDDANQITRLSMGDPLFRSTVTSSLQPFFTGNFEEDPQTLAPYRPILTALQARSVIDVPLTVRNQGVGEIILCNNSPQFFDRNDLSLVATTAGQMAAAIERSSLYTQTDESLRRRVEQLTALTRISRELNTTLELKSLLQLVYDELLRTTQADCGTILLFNIGEQVSDRSDILLAIGDVVRATHRAICTERQ